MAWFYNLILSRFLEIGLIADPRLEHSPAASAVHKFASFPGNSQIPKILHLEEHENSCFSMACSTRPILPIFASGKRQFGWFQYYLACLRIALERPSAPRCLRWSAGSATFPCAWRGGGEDWV
jgi:hypothetical protein